MTNPLRMLCPDCGTENESPARFCTYCGGMLTQPWGLSGDSPLEANLAPETAFESARSGVPVRASGASAPVGEGVEWQELMGSGTRSSMHLFPSDVEVEELQELLSRPAAHDLHFSKSEWGEATLAETAALAHGNSPAGEVRPGSAHTSRITPDAPARPNPLIREPTLSPAGRPIVAAAAPASSTPAVALAVDAGTKRRGSSLPRTITFIAGAAVLTGFLGYLGAVYLIKPNRNDQLAVQPTISTPTGGHLSLEVPSGLPAKSLQVTVLQDGKPVKATTGELLDRLPPEKMGGVALDAGSYLVRFVYRRTPLREVRSEIRKGQDTIIQPSRWQLADIEYSAGEAAARRGGPDEHGDSDVVHFQRALKFDPDHVNAHLQMAAYQLLKGTRADVEIHLANVRRLAPKHADLAQLEALLKRRRRRN